MNIQEAAARAAKLLRLAQSQNQHEAALAMARAQEIIDRYKLDIDGLNPEAEAESNEPVKDWGAADPIDGNTRDVWKGVLLVGLCNANDAKAYKSGPRLCIIGRASDVQTVRYMYGFITRQVEQFAARDCAGHSRTYWNNYRHGMVETINRRLRDQRAETVQSARQEAQATNNSAALVRIDRALLRIEAVRAEVEKQGKAIGLRSRGHARSTYNGEARARGRTAGESVRMGGSAGLNRGTSGMLN